MGSSRRQTTEQLNNWHPHPDPIGPSHRIASHRHRPSARTRQSVVRVSTAQYKAVGLDYYVVGIPTRFEGVGDMWQIDLLLRTQITHNIPFN